MMVATTATALQAIIDTVTALVTAFAAYVSQWLTVIFTSGNELLLACICLPLIGVGIGLIHRILPGGKAL